MNFAGVVFLSPIAIATTAATPNPATSGQRVGLSVAVSSSAGSISSVTAAAGSVGGPASLSLNLSATANVFTNSFVPVTNVFPTSVSLPFVVKDSVGNLIISSINFILVATNDVWNGNAAPDNTWANGLNWAGGASPILDSQVTFAGKNQTNVDMESSYTLSTLNFSTNAGSFNLTNNANTLTLTANGFVINNSTNLQTLSVPISLGSASLAGGVTLEAFSNNLALNQALNDGGAGPGSLTTVGPGATILTGACTYSGNTTIQSGTLAIADPGQLGGGAYAGAITDNGLLSFSSTAAETLSGIISGTGGLTVGATNSVPGTVDLVLQGGANPYTYTGPTVVNAGELDLNFNNAAASGIYASSSLTINDNGTVMLLVNNALCGSATPIGTLPVTVNSGGVLNGNGYSSHIRGLLTLNGGTLADTGANTAYGNWDLDDGVATAGGPIISTISSLNVVPSQTGGTTFNIPNGGTPGGIDLNVTGSLINGTSLADTGVIKNGNGTMQLSGVNTYVGGTTINTGTLILADPGQLNSGSYAGNIINAGTFISSTTAGQTLSGTISGNGLLEVTGTGAMLTLSGINTYTGPTIVGPGATLFMSGSGSIANSPSITVSNTATLDVSAATSATDLPPGQNLYANGSVNGAFTSSATSGIFPGTDGTYGTNTFLTSLTLDAGATLDFDIGTVYNQSNDEIIVNGPLNVGADVFIHFKAPSSASSLDASGNDYVLLQASSISGSFASAPAFVLGSVPVNGGNFSIVTDPILNQVRLHYSTTAAPLITTVSAMPSSVVCNGSVFVSVNVIPGAGSLTNISVSLAALGGTSVGLVQQGLTSVYTNTIIVPPGAAPGTYNLTASATDTTPLSAAGNVSFVVVATTETWNGGGTDENWDTAANWISQLPPGYVGDSLVFGGTRGLAPVLDQDYTVQSLTFSNTAGAFAIGYANGDYLSLSPKCGVTNNSASVETFNLPVVLDGAATLKSATASGNLVFNQPVSEFPAGSGLGVITNAGGTNIFNSTNTYSGSTIISSNSTLTIGPGGDLGDLGTGTGGAYAANISDNGTFNFYGGVPQTFTGVLSGKGAFNIVGGTPTNGVIVTLDSQSTFTGNLSFSNTYVSVTATANALATSAFGNPASNGLVTINNNAILSLDASGGSEFSGHASTPGPNLGVVINNGGLMQITASTANLGPVTLNGGTILIANAGTAYNAQPLALSGTITVGGSVPSLITNSTDGPFSGCNMTVEDLAGNITFNVAATGSAGPDLTVAVPLSDPSQDNNAQAGILKSGAGTMALTDPNNSYDGSTAITAGTLIVADPGLLGGYYPKTITGTYSGIIANSGTLIVSTTQGQTLAGPISGTGSLIVETNQPVTVAPTAMLTLTASNTYTGATIIGPGGDLVLQGSINNSPLIDVQSLGTLNLTNLPGFTANAGQVLRGSGNILLAGNTLTVNGVLAAGETNALGTLNLDNSGLTLSDGSTTSLRINKTAGGLTSDMVVGISTATYGGTLTVTNTGSGQLALGDSFTLFGATGGLGNFSGIAGAPLGYGFTFFPNSGALTVTTVPPTTGTNITFSVSGKTLTLSWPAAYIGSTLQSNSISLANPNAWFNIAGSSSVTNENITIGKGNVFFRLVTP